MEMLCNHFNAVPKPVLNTKGCTVPDYLTMASMSTLKKTGEPCQLYIERLKALRDSELKLLEAAHRDVQNGMSYAEVSIKYGKTFYFEPTNQGIKVVGAAVSGLIAGGPIGAVVGAAGAVVANEAASSKSKKSVESEIKELTALGWNKENITAKYNPKPVVQNTTTPDNTNLLASFGDSNMYALIGVVLLVVVMALFVGRKKS